MKKATLLIVIATILLNGVGFAQANDGGVSIVLADLMSYTYINILLITVGFVGLIIEIFSPGFGIGGIISIISFGIFFAGNYVAGNTEWISLLIFVVGMILLVIEAIVPGFGLPGISGIIMIILGIIFAMDSLETAILSLSISIIITAIITVVLIKQGRSIEAFNRIILSTEQKDEKGYLSSSNQNQYLGKEGVAITNLRPSGIIKIDEDKLDALSEGKYISKGSEIKIVKVEGRKIIVRRL